MNRQARSIAASLVIHGAACAAILFAAAVPPATRAIVLDFSLNSSNDAGQHHQPATRLKQHREERTITPLIKDETAMPIPQEVTGELPIADRELPGTGAEGDGVPDGSEAAAGDHYVAIQFIHIRDKILRNLSYPPLARKMGWAGKVVVSFTVCIDGSVENAVVRESSGYPVLDHSAIEAIRKACPLPIPPVKTGLMMPVLYRLE